MFPAWTSIYYARPTSPRRFCTASRYADVHLYNEAGDVLFAARQLLGAHTVAGGPRTFTLPQSAEVIYSFFERRERTIGGRQTGK